MEHPQNQSSGDLTGSSPNADAPGNPPMEREEASNADDPPHGNDRPDRRKMLTVLLGAGGAFWGGVVGIPALLAAFTPAFRSERGPLWRTLGRLDDFTIGAVEQAVFRVRRGGWGKPLDEKSVYVWRQSEDEAVVYSRNCTDLSCPVTYDGGSECFFCPCHGGIFAKDGTPMAGPPPRPLYRYDARVRAGRLELDANSLPPMT